MFSKLIFNRLPWWLFAAVFLGAAPLSIGLVVKAVNAQIAMDDVKTQGPTEVIPLDRFTPDQVVNAFGEIQINGRYAGVEGTISKSKADIHYLLILPDGDIGPGLIVQDIAVKREQVLGHVAARLQPDGALILSGFVQSEVSWKDLILRDLREKKITVPDDLYQLDAYWGPREEALRAFLIEQWGMAGVSVFLAMALGFATRLRFRAVQKKKRERRERKRRAEEASWQDTPIQTQKGWLG